MSPVCTTSPQGVSIMTPIESGTVGVTLKKRVEEGPSLITSSCSTSRIMTGTLEENSSWRFLIISAVSLRV